MKHNVPIFHTAAKDLRDFTTTEKDKKKQISKFPSNDYRCEDEDLYKLSSPAPLLKHQESTAEDAINNFDSTQKVRQAQINDGSSNSSFMTEDDSQMGESDFDIKK